MANHYSIGKSLFLIAFTFLFFDFILSLVWLLLPNYFSIIVWAMFFPLDLYLCVCVDVSILGVRRTSCQTCDMNIIWNMSRCLRAREYVLRAHFFFLSPHTNTNTHFIFASDDLMPLLTNYFKIEYDWNEYYFHLTIYFLHFFSFHFASFRLAVLCSAEFYGNPHITFAQPSFFDMVVIFFFCCYHIAWDILIT